MSQADSWDIKLKLMVQFDYAYTTGSDNGDQAVGLPDGSIASQDVSVLQDGLVGWSVFADLEDAVSLGKLASVLFVLGAASVQIVETYNMKEEVTNVE